MMSLDAWWRAHKNEIWHLASVAPITSTAYETSVAPAQEQRCEICERIRIDMRRIDRGLAELVANAPLEWNGADPMFDLGGEG